MADDMGENRVQFIERRRQNTALFALFSFLINISPLANAISQRLFVYYLQLFLFTAYHLPITVCQLDCFCREIEVKSEL